MGHTSRRLSERGCPILFNTPQLAVALPDTRKLVYPFQMDMYSCCYDYVIMCERLFSVRMLFELARGTGEASSSRVYNSDRTNYRDKPSYTTSRDEGHTRAHACAEEEREYI